MDNEFNTSSRPDEEYSGNGQKRKSLRKTFNRFADKTSMTGINYISSARFWWAKVIWSFMLFIAVGVMGLHLWYLFSQYFEWPVQTKISLGFDSLQFPDVTICNTNQLHQRRLDHHPGLDKLKGLLDKLKPEEIKPNPYDYVTTDSPTTTPDIPTGGPSPGVC